MLAESCGKETNFLKKIKKTLFPDFYCWFYIFVKFFIIFNYYFEYVKLDKTFWY